MLAVLVAVIANLSFALHVLGWFVSACPFL
jgi:hypothetical protein